MILKRQTNHTMTETICPGCRGMFPEITGPTHPYMESSPGCWAAYGRLLAREYGDPACYEVHRLSVDAYAVQHPGRPSRRSVQSVGVHLIRLFLFLESGLPAESVNEVMQAAMQIRDSFTWLEPPAGRGEVTVADVVDLPTAEAHCARVQQWAAAAWQAWSGHRETIEKWVHIARHGIR